MKSKLMYTTIIALVCAALALSWYVYVRSTQPAVTTVVAEKGTLVQEVSVTGKAKAVDSVDLGFDQGGQITSVRAQAGSTVHVGDVIATLDSAALEATIQQAAANRDSEAAKLSDLQNGTPETDLAVLNAQVQSAQTSALDARHALESSLSDAYRAADDAVHVTIDQYIANPRGSNPLFMIVTSDTQRALAVNAGRPAYESLLQTWKQYEDASDDSVLTFLGTAHSTLDTLSGYLGTIATALQTAQPSSTVTQPQIDAYKVAVATARATINAEIAALNAGEAKMNTANAAIDIAQKQLTAKQSGTTPAALSAQAARVRQYDAQIKSIQASVDQTILRSPINGVVTIQNAKVGQTVTPGMSLTTIISDGLFTIEGYVPEISIGKVAVGNKVEAVFDAFPGQKIEGTVTSIDPGETIIDGVTNFKIHITLSDTSAIHLRSGLTADVTIIGDEKPDVISIPIYTVQTDDSGSFVTVLKDGTQTKTPVTVGMVGGGGKVQVLSGLAPGDVVVVPFGSTP